LLASRLAAEPAVMEPPPEIAATSGVTTTAKGTVAVAHAADELT
jgi:hypothetical protein